MPHIHWVARQNKLEIPRDKDEVNKREIQECDGRAHDQDTMVAPLTPKPTLTVEVLVRAPPTIASCREEDSALRKWPLPRYCCARCILETKTKVGSTTVKVPTPRTNPRARDPEATAAPPTPKPTRIHFVIVYYESIKRELKIRGIYECRCDERLLTKIKRFRRLPYTGFFSSFFSFVFFFCLFHVLLFQLHSGEVRPATCRSWPNIRGCS